MAPGRMDCSPNSGSIQPHLSRKKVSIRLLDLKWYNSSCRLSDKNKRRAEKHSPILYEPRLPRAEGEALKQFDNKLHQDTQQDHHQDFSPISWPRSSPRSTRGCWPGKELWLIQDAVAQVLHQRHHTLAGSGAQHLGQEYRETVQNMSENRSKTSHCFAPTNVFCWTKPQKVPRHCLNPYSRQVLSWSYSWIRFVPIRH